MENPVFLDLDMIDRLHRDLIATYGGLDGVRDQGLLESALAQPKAGFGGQYFHADLFEMAAAYLYHLVLNHPYLDGNKRIGAAAAIVFLAINDIDIENDEDGLVNVTLAVATGTMDKPAIAQFFRERSLIQG
ncbi:MAG: type II toxin-antitoxin system death-on-curing family toxin [Phycisphaerales bacterium]|nr:type II toxin-antitoxin system death-on-curing family toxin [Phycisphaerales bacterium]